MLQWNIQQVRLFNKLCILNVALSSQVLGYCLVDLKIKEALYNKVKFLIMKNLYCSVILGHDFPQQHSYVEIQFGEPRSSLKL